jgi:hypothetical protein
MKHGKESCLQGAGYQATDPVLTMYDTYGSWSEVVIAPGFFPVCTPSQGPKPGRNLDLSPPFFPIPVMVKTKARLSAVKVVCSLDGSRVCPRESKHCKA